MTVSEPLAMVAEWMEENVLELEREAVVSAAILVDEEDSDRDARDYLRQSHIETELAELKSEVQLIAERKDQ